MNGAKPWYASSGVLGGVAGALVSLLALLGYAVSTADMTTAVSTIVSIITAVSSLVALYGRIRATKTIHPSVTGKPASTADRGQM